MPSKNRGDPVTGNNNRWSEPELTVLYVFFHEYRGLSEDQMHDIWHTMYPQMVQNGREYSYDYLDNYYRFRHYPGKNSFLRNLARPNGVGDTGAHTNDERNDFAAARVKISSAIRGKGLAVQLTGRRADDGVNCTCAKCNGTAKPRNEGLEDKGNREKTKARVANANRRSTGTLGLPFSTSLRDDDEVSDTEPENNMAALGLRRSGRKASKPTYTEEDQDDADMEVEQSYNLPESGSQITQAGPQFRANQIQEPQDTETLDAEPASNACAMSSDGTSASQLSGLPMVGNIYASKTPRSTSELSKSKEAAKIQAGNPIKLIEVNQAKFPLLMIHHRDLQTVNGKLRLPEDGFQIVPKDDPIYLYGGQVVMVSPPTQKIAPFMACDSIRCNKCHKKKVDKDLVSPSSGLPFIHQHECFSDEESKLLFFAPEPACTYGPPIAGQEMSMRKVVIDSPMGARIHTAMVCDQTTCAHCLKRQAAGHNR